MSRNVTAETQPIYTEKEAADLLRLSAINLRRIRTRGEIPHYRFGKRVLYSACHLEDFKRQHERNVQLPVAA